MCSGGSGFESASDDSGAHETCNDWTDAETGYSVTRLRGRAASLRHSPYQFSMYSIKTFMIEANNSVNYVAEERAHNEWAERRIWIKSNAYCIVRTDSDAELKYDCECGMPEHILAVVKSSEERRRLAT
jgi:hypothetical protein